MIRRESRRFGINTTRSFTGLHYYWARFYDAQIGRFISEDPIDFAGRDINLYGYVWNNPLRFRDPSGKIVPLIIGGIVIGSLILTSPSYVNAPGPGDPVYYPDNPLILNAAGGSACDYLFTRFASPFLSRLASGMGDDIIELGISSSGREIAESAPTGFDDVAGHIANKGELPSNFITKAEAKSLGWNPKLGNLDKVAPGKSIGGDPFKNIEGLLPKASGRAWFEADINYSGGFRGSDRLLYSNDGLFFKTIDHYKTFVQIN